MVILTRKQREMEAREAFIIDHAQALLEKKGYLGLNLDELAERVEYSKGTIYGHFDTKEDLLLGVVIRLSEERGRLFRHATRFPGLTRERMCAVGIADTLLNERRPHAFQFMQLVTTASVWEKTSLKRRQHLKSTSEEMIQSPLDLSREALFKGDITLADTRPEQIILGLFAMSKGAMLVQANASCFPDGWSEAMCETIQINRHRYLDGFGWRPLTDEHDYASVEERIRSEWFLSALDKI